MNWLRERTPLFFIAIVTLLVVIIYVASVANFYNAAMDDRSWEILQE